MRDQLPALAQCSKSSGRRPPTMLVYTDACASGQAIASCTKSLPWSKAHSFSDSVTVNISLNKSYFFPIVEKGSTLLIQEFPNKKYIDDGAGLGYWVPLYSLNGEIIPGARAGYARASAQRCPGHDGTRWPSAGSAANGHAGRYAHATECRNRGN